jgi:cellobiose PTS system EIIB component
MSTSLIAKRMKAYASELGEQHRIWTVPGDVAHKHIKDADILLIGPQLRHMLPQLKELGDAKGIPVDIINMIDYGTCNGKNVLNFAMELIKNRKDSQQ